MTFGIPSKMQEMLLEFTVPKIPNNLLIYRNYALLITGTLLLSASAMPLADDLQQQADRHPSTSFEDSTTTTFSTETTPFSTTPSTINPTSDSTTDSTTPKTLSLADYQFAYSWLIHYGYIEEVNVTLDVSFVDVWFKQ